MIFRVGTAIFEGRNVGKISPIVFGPFSGVILWPLGRRGREGGSEGTMARAAPQGSKGLRQTACFVSMIDDTVKKSHIEGLLSGVLLQGCPLERNIQLLLSL